MLRMILMNCLAVAAFLLPYVFTPGLAAGETIRHPMLDVAHADIILTVLGCGDHLNGDVTLNGAAPDGINWRQLPDHADDENTAAGYGGLEEPFKDKRPQLRIRVKPGYYPSFSVRIGKCQLASFPLIASSSYGTRRLTAIRAGEETSSSTSADTSGVYGTIASPGFAVELRNEQGTTICAEVERTSDMLGDHYTYFADAVTPGKYTIMLRGPMGTRTVATVDVPRARMFVYKRVSFDETP